ncbi:MAG: hypothetical protein FWB98_02160 [Defluviitaleaceae bacterium]|nr:hypothetical protein [Defluviitaleaceae bacterium]
MKRTRLRITAVFMAIAMVFVTVPIDVLGRSVHPPTYEGFPGLYSEYMPIGARFVISEELIHIEGFPIMIRTYYENGMLIDTATIMEDVQGSIVIMEYDSEANSYLPENLNFRILEVMMSQTQQDTAPTDNYANISPLSGIGGSGWREEWGVSTRNSNIQVMHNFGWQGWSVPPVVGGQGIFGTSQLTLSNGQVFGFYFGQGNAYSMRLSQTFTTGGNIAITSVSIPWPSFGITNSNSVTWNSGLFHNVAVWISRPWSGNFVASTHSLITPANMVTLSSTVDVGTRIGAGNVSIIPATATTRLSINGPNH